MSKKVNEAQVEPSAPKGEREALWERFLENYKKENPVKYAAKMANGDFDKIPVSFLGRVIVTKGKEAIY